jgi:hypothetical protein
MRLVAGVAVGMLFLSACAQDQTEELASPSPASVVPIISVADFVGTWSGMANLPGSAPVESVITVAGDGSGTLVLPDRDPIPMQLSISGDSLVGVAAEYESVLRPGVRVLTRVASVRSGDSLSGSVVATYRTPGGDEVVVGTTQFERTP